MSEVTRTEREIELSERKLDREIVSLDLDIEAKALELRAKTKYMKETEAKADEARVLTFYGSVSSASASAAIAKLSDWHRRDPGEPIEIVFNSPGGSIIDGLALYDYIKHIQAAGTRVTTITMGMAASMGGILLQAGDLRVASKNAVLLIHEVSSGAGGKVSEIEDELEFMKMLQDKCLNILASRSTMTVRQIAHKWKKKDWWLSADEALNLGFIDEIR